jgi:hypothetical protein
MRSSSSEWRWTDADLRCFGSLAWHERRKRSSGGAITNEENLVGACDYHNCWVEDRPLIARALFGTQLVVREGDEEWSRLGARISRKGDS